MREIEFTISDVFIDLIIDRYEISLGEKLDVNGTTNVAKTDSKFDDTSLGLNKVKIHVYGAEGQLLSSYTANINENREFSEEITFSLTWDKDVEYKIVANVTTGNGYFAEDFEFIEVKSPEVRFEMDDLTYIRGEEIRFTGKSTLGAGSSVYIYEDDLGFLAPHAVTTYAGEQYVKAMVGADGSWQTDRMRVLEDAPIGQYTVHAVIFSPGTPNKLDEDSIRINIVKNELEASVDKTIVWKGGSIIVNGSTTADYIFVFASEADVFEDVTENPDERIYSVGGTDMMVRPENGKFSRVIEVREDADEGYYYLYLYAPSSAERINTDEDPQKSFIITIISELESNESSILHTPEPVMTNESTEVQETETPEISQTVETVETPLPEQTTTPSAKKTKEVKVEQTVEETVKKEIEKPFQDEMTIPKLRKMLPGFEAYIAFVCLALTLMLRKLS